MNCPECNSENVAESPVAGMLRCGDCAHYFPAPLSEMAGERLAGTPAPPTPPPPAVPPAAPEATMPESAEDAALKERRQLLHNRADMFTALAFFGYIFSVIALGLTITAEIGGDSPEMPLRFLFISLALGLAFHVLAQLIHIRANTER
jgi:hypothetical protein